MNVNSTILPVVWDALKACLTGWVTSFMIRSACGRKEDYENLSLNLITAERKHVALLLQGFPIGNAEVTLALTEQPLMHSMQKRAD